MSKPTHKELMEWLRERMLWVSAGAQLATLNGHEGLAALFDDIQEKYETICFLILHAEDYARLVEAVKEDYSPTCTCHRCKRLCAALKPFEEGK